MELENLKETKVWLKSQEVENGYYKSHKAALISSSNPFGVFGSYIDGKTKYHYLNGKIDSVEHEGQEMRYN